VGSSTSEELITVVDCQSSRHRLDTKAVASADGFPSRQDALMEAEVLGDDSCH